MTSTKRRKMLWVVICNASQPEEFRRWAHASRASAVKRQRELDEDKAPCGPHSVSRLAQERKDTV